VTSDHDVVDLVALGVVDDDACGVADLVDRRGR
jgi:hypothetical protein